MSKSYMEFMNEITADELYKGLLAHGMFADKLPPIFTAVPFFDYCPSVKQPFSDDSRDYISFDSYRNVGIPRQLGIPNPFAYQKLCEDIRDNWDTIKAHFEKQTQDQTHKISRTHIRKLENSDSLFEMNYKNWESDGSPENDLLIGAKYVVEADISTCFPSLYSHSIPWAIVGKEESKANKGDDNIWYNKIDHYCQQIRYGETHGFMIGPHASNLLSEIVLTCVDKSLYDKGYRYTRFIDDYKCYVPDYNKAQQFITDLNQELRKFDLPLNAKKTKIKELPLTSTEDWVRIMSSFELQAPYGKIDYKKITAYLDTAIKLISENSNNAATLKYAFKVIVKKKKKLTQNAADYFVKSAMHLSIIYPYLFLLMEDFVFKLFEVGAEKIKSYAEKVWDDSVTIRNYEGSCYALLFAINHKFKLDNVSLDFILDSDNCILKLMGWLYYKSIDDKTAIKKLKGNAQTLSEHFMDRNWLFIYEVLPSEQLHDEWKPMKKAKVSFLRPEYQI